MMRAKRSHGRALPLLAAAGLLAACAGENLFTGPAAGSSGPQVDITAPAEGEVFTVGATVSVAATATAQAGAANARIKGIHLADETAAFTAQSRTLDGLVNVSLSAELLAAPAQVAGTALIIVEVTDQAGSTGADTVSITLAN